MYTCIIPVLFELNSRSTHARTLLRCIHTYKPTNNPIQMHIHTYIYNSVYVGLFSVNTKGSDGCTSKAPVSVVGLYFGCVYTTAVGLFWV